jgi:hypothetical protein
MWISFRFDIKWVLLILVLGGLVGFYLGSR